MFGRIKNFILTHTSFGKTRYLNFLYRYDMQKYLSYSGMNEDNPERLAMQMRLIAHAIEKGMSLPECKEGFGKEKIQKLISLHDEYSRYANRKDIQVLDLVRKTISEYVDYQKRIGEDTSFISDEFKKSIDVQLDTGIMYLRKKEITEFENVAKERHSLRYYSSKKIEIKDIVKAVSLAQTAPSACNRQATHVFACINGEKIDEIFKLHGGIRGFGKPTVVFVITGDLNLYQNEYERNTVFVDGGIFLMNLLYALDCKGIAACPVIWGTEPDNDEKISALLSIPASHKIISLVTAGYFPEEEYKVARSPKRPTESVLHIIS